MGNLTLTPHELATGTSMSVRACIMGRRSRRRWRRRRQRRTRFKCTCSARWRRDKHFARSGQEATVFWPLFVYSENRSNQSIYINSNIYKFPADLVSPHLARSHSYWAIKLWISCWNSFDHHDEYLFVRTFFMILSTLSLALWRLK